jgi:hypothetical protein
MFDREPLLPVLLLTFASCFLHQTVQASDVSSEKQEENVGTFKCFESHLELAITLHYYLNDNSPGTIEATTYGHPIGTWCVEKVTSFENLFYRLHNADKFNEDISGWNVRYVSA